MQGLTARCLGNSNLAQLFLQVITSYNTMLLYDKPHHRIVLEPRVLLDLKIAQLPKYR